MPTTATGPCSIWSITATSNDASSSKPPASSLPPVVPARFGSALYNKVYPCPPKGRPLLPIGRVTKGDTAGRAFHYPVKPTEKPLRKEPKMEAQGVKNGSASILKWKRKHF